MEYWLAFSMDQSLYKSVGVSTMCLKQVRSHIVADSPDNLETTITVFPFSPANAILHAGEDTVSVTPAVLASRMLS